MSKGADQFLKKTLGDDFLESLAKVELWKPGTRTTIDHEEIKTALKIVPRAIMSFLIQELSGMKIGEHKDIRLPLTGKSALIRVDKNERDVYSGQIEEDNKFVVDFKFRSLPGIGLVILSAFELYDINQLNNDHDGLADGVEDRVQKMIDERIALHSLISNVVEQKVSHKEAMSQLMLAKLTAELNEAKEELQKEKAQIANVAAIANREPEAQKDEYFRGLANGLAVADAVANDKEPEFIDSPAKKMKSPLKAFLDNRAKKKAPTFDVYMAKGETVDCPDCGKNIFDGKIFSGCICLGDDREKKLYIKKTEEGINVRFGRGWDPENIEMLLDVLRKKHG